MDQLSLNFSQKIPDTRNIIISLFDYSSSWSLPYQKAGYEVIQVDIKHGIDILDWDYKQIDKSRVLGLLIAPPCTDYTTSGNRFWKIKDDSGQTEKSNRLVRKALEIKDYFDPYFWSLENPVGRLNTCIPELSSFGPWYWQPFDFGDPWTKKTGLWGKFNRPRGKRVASFRWSDQGSWSQLLGKKNERTKEIRSITPWGFSQEFFKANNPLNLQYEENTLNLFGRCPFGLWSCHFAVCKEVCNSCEDGDSYEPDDFAMEFDTEEEFMLAIFDKGEGIKRSVDPQLI